MEIREKSGYSNVINIIMKLSGEFLDKINYHSRLHVCGQIMSADPFPSLTFTDFRFRRMFHWSEFAFKVLYSRHAIFNFYFQIYTSDVLKAKSLIFKTIFTLFK